jgi:hypothetical protein
MGTYLFDAGDAETQRKLSVFFLDCVLSVSASKSLSP